MFILLVDKDAAFCHHALQILERAGFDCALTSRIRDASALCEQRTPDLVILDTRMPWTQCHPFMASLAQKRCPLLFVSQVLSMRTHLLALYHASADVISLPINARQLIDKSLTLINQTTSHASSGGLQLNPIKKTASLNGRAIKLTTQEFALLEALMQAADTPVSRQELLKNAWGYLSQGETRTVDVHIQRLRRKLGNEHIETVYKMGYRLKMV